MRFPEWLRRRWVLGSGTIALLAGTACSTASSSRAARPAVAPAEPSLARLLIDRATEDFYAGKDAALSGDFQCADLEFQRALDLVTGPEAHGAEVEDFSRSLIESIVRYDELERASAEAGEAAADRGTPAELVGVAAQAPRADLDRAREEVRTDQRSGGFDIPIAINDQVLAMIANFTSNPGVRRRFQAGLARAGRYMPMIRSIFDREGLPSDLAYVAMIESSFTTQARSRARAHGIWQFMAATGRRYGLRSNRVVDERADPVKATQAAAALFRDLYDDFDDWYLAMAAYDAGEGRIARALSRTGTDNYWDLCRSGAIPRETRLYVPSVLAAAIIAKNPKHYGFDVSPETPIRYETVRLHKPVSLPRLAAACHLRLADLRLLNPELRLGVTPRISGGYELRVPPGSRDAVVERLGSLPAARVPALLRHRVRRGDTLSTIARRYGVAVRLLARANHLSLRTRLRVGRWLLIPGGRAPRYARLETKRHRPGATPAAYHVRRGDTLYAIAQRHNTTVADLRRWNKLVPGDEIHPGDRILIQQN